AARRITAQRHDTLHSGGTIFLDNAVNVLASRIDAGQMGCGIERRLADQAPDGRKRRRLGGTAGPVCNGHEIRVPQAKLLDGLPQLPFHVRRARRKELEGNAGGFSRSFGRCHGRFPLRAVLSSSAASASRRRRSRASQTVAVSDGPPCLSVARSIPSWTSRPPFSSQSAMA